VICTPNSGPPPPHHGGVHEVQIGDPAALAETIAHIGDDYPAARPPAVASPAYAIEAYGRRLVDALADLDVRHAA